MKNVTIAAQSVASVKPLSPKQKAAKVAQKKKSIVTLTGKNKDLSGKIALQKIVKKAAAPKSKEAVKSAASIKALQGKKKANNDKIKALRSEIKALA